MKLILVDDESDSLELLELEIKALFPQFEILGKFSNPKEATQAINTHQPDLVFLDIQMPMLSGLEVAERITSTNTKVVFLTAYSDFAIQAFKVRAVDYLLKPIDTKELKNCIDNIISTLKSVSETNVPQGIKDEVVKIPTNEGIAFFKIEDIILCKAESNYTTIISRDRKLLVSKTLKYIQSLLPKTIFIRSHKSYLVNKNHILEYSREDGGCLKLTNNEVAYLAKSKRDLFTI